MFRIFTTAIAVGASAADHLIHFAFGFSAAFCGFTLVLPLLNGIIPLPGA
jgi:hypothetical protein